MRARKPTAGRGGQAAGAGRSGPRRAADLSDAVSLSEAARLLGVTVRTVQNYVRRGLLAPFYLPGSGRPRIPLADVNALRRRAARGTDAK